MSIKYLLGATADKEIVFAEFSATHPRYWSKEKGNWTDETVREFSASFDTVRPFVGSDYDLEEYYEGWMDGLDKADLYDLCERHWCSPQDLPGKLAEECYDVRDALDCSLYPEVINVDETDWYFESGSCGQHDTREDGMDEYVNEEAYNLLHELWDKYHLKPIDEDGIKQMQRVVELLDEVDEEEWIADYIRRNY